MESLKEIITMLFGDKVTLDQIFTMAVGVFAVIKSFTEWRATKKLIKADKERTAIEEELELQKQRNEHLVQACSSLAEIVVTAYLSSNTISSETKKELVTMANNLKENASLQLTKPVTALIEAVEKGANVDLSTVKQEVLEKTKNIDEVVDIVKESTQNAIDKITV